MEKEVKEYFEKYVIDTSVSKEYCIKNNLPYFDDDWKLVNTHKFCETANNYEKYKKYTLATPKTKDWVDFWLEERRRCLEGYTCGQIKVTADFYFFLNFYRLKIADEVHGEIESFPKFWDVHFWLSHLIQYAEITKQDFVFVKLRGMGATEFMASKAVRQTMLSKEIDNNTKQFKSTLLVAAISKYLTGSDGLFTKVTRAIIWLNTHTDEGIYQLFQHTMKQDEMHWVAGYRDKKNQPIQTGGEVKGLVLEKPDDIRGGRYSTVMCEESGANPKLTQMVRIVSSNVKRAGIKTGNIFIWGTSNEDPAGMEGFKKIMLNPTAYDCVKFKNVWTNNDISKQYVSKISRNPFEYIVVNPYEEGVGYFIPAYTIKYFDEHGNADWEKAYDDLMEERKIKSSQDDVMIYIADYPIKIEEALIVSKGKRFNIKELAKQMVMIETKAIKPDICRGFFEFKRDINGKIIGVCFYPSHTGHVQILEHPQNAVYNKDDNYWFVPIKDGYPDKLYIAGIDSIDQGTAESETKGSSIGFLVKKRIIDAINDPYSNAYVCLYNERPSMAKYGWEQVACGLVYYNAIGLLEFTKIGIKDYIVDQLKLSKHLASEPDAPGEVINTYKKRIGKKGIRITKDIIHFYLNLIEDYIKDYAHVILFKPLLEQLVEYSIENKTKYDLVAAMGMCEILNAEYREIKPTVNKKKITKELPRWHYNSKGQWVFDIPDDTYSEIFNTKFSPDKNFFI